MHNRADMQEAVLIVKLQHTLWKKRPNVKSQPTLPCGQRRLDCLVGP